MGLDQKWKPKVVVSLLKEDGTEKENTYLFLQQWRKKENSFSLMKSKIVALSKNEEFKTLLKQKKITNKYVSIFFGKLRNKDNKKLNISFVTKKKIGNAVKRNKIKRRLRNIMNEAIKKIEINFDYSFLVIAKSSMLNNEYEIIKETLFQDFEKIK